MHNHRPRHVPSRGWQLEQNIMTLVAMILVQWQHLTQQQNQVKYVEVGELSDRFNADPLTCHQGQLSPLTPTTITGVNSLGNCPAIGDFSVVNQLQACIFAFKRCKYTP